MVRGKCRVCGEWCCADYSPVCEFVPSSFAFIFTACGRCSYPEWLTEVRLCLLRRHLLKLVQIALSLKIPMLADSGISVDTKINTSEICTAHSSRLSVVSASRDQGRVPVIAVAVTLGIILLALITGFLLSGRWECDWFLSSGLIEKCRVAFRNLGGA